MVTIQTKYDTVRQQLQVITDLVNSSPASHDSLTGGNLGKALYHFHHWKHFSSEDQRVKGNEIIDQVMQKLFNQQSKLIRNISISSGLAGLAWSLRILQKETLIDFDPTDITIAIERRLIEAIIFQIQDDNLDFLHSSIGALAYLSDSMEVNSTLKKQLVLCIQGLSEKMSHTDNNIAYIRNHFLYKKYNHSHIDEVNLSISHGMCSILLIIIALHKKEVAFELTKSIIEKGVNFIISTIREDNYDNVTHSIFPTNSIVTLPKEHGQNLAFYKQRTGWCYGDLNQILLLYKAGKLLNRADWIVLADKVGAFTLQKKDSKSTHVEDIYLCHGTAGLSTFYDTLYHVSGNAQYLEGREYWMNKTIEELDKMFKQNAFPKNVHGYLEGLAGTGLALMSYLNDENSSWKKFLLLDY